MAINGSLSFPPVGSIEDPFTLPTTSAIYFKLPGSVEINSSNMGATQASVEFDGAFPAATTTKILQQFVDGNSFDSSLIIGGASQPPIVTPEIDNVTFFSSPNDGDMIIFDWSFAGYEYVFDASIVFAASTGSVLDTGTIGISDSPTEAQIATFICADLNTADLAGNGITLTVSGNVITNTCVNGFNFLFSAQNNTGSVISQITVQNGLDFVYELVANGNSVTTN